MSTVTVPITTTVVMNVSTVVTCMPTTEQLPQCTCPSQQDEANNTPGVNNCEANTQQENNQVMAATLGVLTGLFLVILVVVTIGWVWTCWTMKKWRNKTVSSK